MASVLRSIERDINRRKVAVAYARFSSNNQREESIDAQLRAIREYCEKEDIKLIAEFTDEAVSGKTDDREDFQNMINQLLKGHLQVDYVLVHKFNRLSRDKYNSAFYKKKLKDIGVKVISVTQKIDDTPEGEMLEGFLEVIDQYYSQNLALEVRKGLKENALKGKHNGGRKMLGLSVDENGHYYANDDAWIVRRIFEEYASGVPKSEICRRLNEEGIRNQYGRTFNSRHIYDLLKNEKYIGVYQYTITAKEIVRIEEFIHDTIIDFELWERVKLLRSEPTKKKYRERKRYYHLTGKTKCAECGMPISGAGAKKQKNGDIYSYYKCSGKTKHKNGCTNTSINKEWFESNVLKIVVDTVLNNSMIEEIASIAYAELEASRKKPENSTEQLKARLAVINTKQSRLMELYLDSDMDKQMLDEKNEDLRQQKRAIESKIEKNKAIEESNSVSQKDISELIKSYVANLYDLKNVSDDEFMKAVFTTFVELVEVSKTEVIVSVKADLSTLVGAKVKIGGALLLIAPIKIAKSFQRKKNIFGKNS